MISEIKSYFSTRFKHDLNSLGFPRITLDLRIYQDIKYKFFSLEFNRWKLNRIGKILKSTPSTTMRRQYTRKASNSVYQETKINAIPSNPLRRTGIIH